MADVWVRWMFLQINPKVKLKRLQTFFQIENHGPSLVVSEIQINYERPDMNIYSYLILVSIGSNIKKTKWIGKQPMRSHPCLLFLVFYRKFWHETLAYESNLNVCLNLLCTVSIFQCINSVMILIIHRRYCCDHNRLRISTQTIFKNPCQFALETNTNNNTPMEVSDNI